MHKITRSVVLAGLVLLIHFAATAQSAPGDTVVVNSKVTIADSLVHKKIVLTDSIKWRFVGDGNFAKGNVNRAVMVLRAEIQFKLPVISLVTSPRFTYGKQNGALAERDGYWDLYVDVFKKRRFYLFGLGILESSNLRKIDIRQMAGMGLGFRVVNTSENHLTLTNALMYESTNFREKATLTTVRNSFRIKGKHVFLQDKIRINHVTFVQPALNDLSNTRWNTIFSVELPISKYVSFRTSFENFYESVVDTGRKRNDTRLTFGISVGNK
jgi:hypothetical protein